MDDFFYVYFSKNNNIQKINKSTIYNYLCTGIIKPIDMRKAVSTIKLSWKSVSEITIKNCFIKPGFFCARNEVNEDILEDKCQVVFTFQKRNYIKLDDNLECYKEQHSAYTSSSPALKTSMNNSK